MECQANAQYNKKGENKMSRIGNKHIVIPEGVEVKLDGQKITVKDLKVHQKEKYIKIFLYLLKTIQLQ